MFLLQLRLLAGSMSAVEWYKSHAHISFLSKIIHVPTPCELCIIIVWATLVIVLLSKRSYNCKISTLNENANPQ